MRQADVTTLFDYNYWANRKILAAAGRLTDEAFRAPSSITTRDLRGTLVHALDVEWSWRLRLQRDPAESSQSELSVHDYPTVASLAAAWERDEEEMRAWLATLDDVTLARAADVDRRDAHPLWYYLMHLAMHSQQQRSDAAVLLTHLGQSPGDVEFLGYARSGARGGR